MSTERISSGAPAPSVSETAGTREAAESGEKSSPSSFDKVMDKQKEPEGDRDSGHDRQAKPERGLRGAGETDKEVPLRDLSAFYHMRAMTMERPSGAEPLRVEKALPRKIIDEVVQAVRVGVNRAGDKEMQFDLKSHVLDGLRIRVSVHDNKVTTMLEVTTLEAQRKLEAHMGELAQTLEQKGLKVSELQIQFKEEPARPPSYSSQQEKQQQQSQDEPQDEET